VLAPGLARGGSSAGRLAHFTAAPPDWHHGECDVCIDSGGVVFAGKGVGWEKDLISNAMRVLCAISLLMVAGCAATSPKVSTAATPTVPDEAKVIAIARQAIAAKEDWVNRAEFENPNHHADGSWGVIVWRLPKTPGGSRAILINEKGEVTDYLYGL